jgi:hypothetical protein
VSWVVLTYSTVTDELVSEVVVDGLDDAWVQELLGQVDDDDFAAYTYRFTPTMVERVRAETGVTIPVPDDTELVIERR